MRCIDPAAPDFLDRCRALARMVMARGGAPREPVWSDAAELVLAALIAFVAACEPEWSRRNLLTVKRLIGAPEAYARAVKVMQQAGSFGENDPDIIVRLGHQLSWFAEPVPGLIMTTLLRQTAWLDSPGAGTGLSAPDFELREIRLDRGLAAPAPARGKMTVWRWLMRRRPKKTPSSREHDP